MACVAFPAWAQEAGSLLVIPVTYCRNHGELDPATYLHDRIRASIDTTGYGRADPASLRLTGILSCESSSDTTLLTDPDIAAIARQMKAAALVSISVSRDSRGVQVSIAVFEPATYSVAERFQATSKRSVNAAIDTLLPAVLARLRAVSASTSGRPPLGMPYTGGDG